jgi:hypothetical protein
MRQLLVPVLAFHCRQPRLPGVEHFILRAAHLRQNQLAVNLQPEFPAELVGTFTGLLARRRNERLLSQFRHLMWRALTSVKSRTVTCSGIFVRLSVVAMW